MGVYILKGVCLFFFIIKEMDCFGYS